MNSTVDCVSNRYTDTEFLSPPHSIEIRHQRGLPGFSAVSWSETAHRHRQGDHTRPQDPAAGRGHLGLGHGEREGRASVNRGAPFSASTAQLAQCSPGTASKKGRQLIIIIVNIIIIHHVYYYPKLLTVHPNPLVEPL